MRLNGMVAVTAALERGTTFPDLDLPDHTGRRRLLSEIAGGDPVALFTSRGWWCPKEQRFLRGLVGLQDEFEVAYARLVVVSVDPPEVQAAFRAGLGARFVLYPDLRIHAAYNGYWFWGRPTSEEVRQDMRAISRAIRSDWGPPR